MRTLEYIKKKYHLSYDVPSPIILKGFLRHVQLIDLFRDLNFKTGAEVGTAKGDYAEQLCQGIPHLKLYCIDPWKVYKDYSDEPDQTILDYYFKKAKQENYPARSIYKLEEAQKKHQFIKPGDRILDLGCHPGSWSL